jgi:hypothetical protein
MDGAKCERAFAVCSTNFNAMSIRRKRAGASLAGLNISAVIDRRYSCVGLLEALFAKEPLL